MATLREIEATYDYLDELFRLSLGAHGDFTGAMFNGDFSKTLNEAQADKHKYILEGINFKKGDRVLDIGSGWGPILMAVQEAGGTAIGLTLSPAQAEWSQHAGLDARLQDWKSADRASLGRIDGLVSVGAFEHFCSIDEYLAGKQDQIYQEFFSFCYDLLPAGGRLYLQTMMWGKEVPDQSTVTVKAPKFSDAWLIAYVEKIFPGSWLPAGLDHVVNTAQSYFKLISENNGRLDYIETMDRWGEEFYKPRWNKLWPVLKWAPRLAFNKEFRDQLFALHHGVVHEVFKREIFTHQRMVFEKI